NSSPDFLFIFIGKFRIPSQLNGTIFINVCDEKFLFIIKRLNGPQNTIQSFGLLSYSMSSLALFVRGSVLFRCSCSKTFSVFSSGGSSFISVSFILEFARRPLRTCFTQKPPWIWVGS